MTQPISFTNASPRFALPFLSPGQSQKEFSVNQAHAAIDALLHLVISGESNTPPTNPVEGECWAIGSAPTGAWGSDAGKIAAYQAGVWLFVDPVEGMRAYDVTAGQLAFYSNGAWIYLGPLASPSGGSTVDSEARTAIDEIITVLADSGLTARS